MPETKNNLLSNTKTMLSIIGILWLVLIAGIFLPLGNLGITPRTIHGLAGILFAPFLHNGFHHLIANSISLFILGIILLYMEGRRAFEILLCITIIGGFGTWLIGRGNHTHIGASIVIYGMIGYLTFYGIFKRNLKAIIVSTAVFIFYSGALMGMLPVAGYVSWEGHLSGFLSGIVIARVYAKR